MVVDFSLKYAKFGHKMTLQSPPFYFQEVTETLMLYKFWNVQFSWYQKKIPSPPQAIISTTSMINTTENMQKLRTSNAARGQNMRFELQQKQDILSCITYMTSQMLLLYIVQ